MTSEQQAMRAQLERRARDLAKVIDSGLPDGIGFALLLFDMVPPGVTEPDGWMTWISNSQRSDMLKALVEMVARFRRDELEGPTPSDIDDVAKTLAAVAPGYTRDVMRAIATLAISLGASPGLARTDAKDGKAPEQTIKDLIAKSSLGSVPMPDHTKLLNAMADLVGTLDGVMDEAGWLLTRERRNEVHQALERVKQAVMRG
jgi:hypothetical protein